MGRIKNIVVILLLVFAGIPMSFAQKVEQTSRAAAAAKFFTGSFRRVWSE